MHYRVQHDVTTYQFVTFTFLLLQTRMTQVLKLITTAALLVTTTHLIISTNLHPSEKIEQKENTRHEDKVLLELLEHYWNTYDILLYSLISVTIFEIIILITAASLHIKQNQHTSSTQEEDRLNDPRDRKDIIQIEIKSEKIEADNCIRE